MIHCILGSRAEGVAFLCKNWDSKRNKPSNDMRLDSPLVKASKLGTRDDRRVTCQDCLKIMYAPARRRK